jgi:ribosome-associated toxin RatA of RatAB toxin-antitoxin module
MPAHPSALDLAPRRALARDLRQRLVAAARPLALALALTSTVAEAAPPKLAADEQTRLDKGEVLVKRVKPTGDKGVAAKAVAIVRAHPDRVWAAVNDCTHFKDFMPRTTKSVESEDGRVCRVEVSMPFPLSDLWSETRVVQTFLDDGGRRRSWTLQAGTYDHLVGSWTVYPHGDTHTLLLYAIDANPTVSVPDFVLRNAQEGTLPDIFAAIRKYTGAE